jgi:hypothetical protein
MAAALHFPRQVGEHPEYREKRLWLKSVRFHPQSLRAALDNGHSPRKRRFAWEMPADLAEELEKPLNRRRPELDALMEE